jgi:Family of unknown function (DUF6272)
MTAIAKRLHDFLSLLKREGVILAYCGYVTEPLLHGVGETLKRRMEMLETDTKTMRSVFAIFVEQMQNLIRYSAEIHPPGSPADIPVNLRYGVLTIGIEDGAYVVYAANLVNRRDVDRMRERLAALSAMNKAELKTAYKEGLKAGTDEFSKGAGVGFVEIARRASKPIEFDFIEVEDGYSFFALKACV